MEACVVLDQCIDSLKSAEEGLELLGYLSRCSNSGGDSNSNYRTSNEKLLKHLLSKKENIMRKFVTEVGIVENEFLVCFS